MKRFSPRFFGSTVFVLSLAAGWAAAAQSIVGVDYGPYRGLESPNGGPFPTAAEMQADMPSLRRMADYIRIYTSRNQVASSPNDQIPAMAKASGLKVVASAYIDATYTKAINDAEVNALITTANSNSNIAFVVVGSETLRRNPGFKPQLLAYINQVKQSVSVPVTTADIWGVWAPPDPSKLPAVSPVLDPDLAAATDLIFLNIHPYWEGQDISGAAQYVENLYNQIKAQTVKPVYISETGWPDAGNTVGNAVANPANQKKFIQDWTTIAAKQSISFFFFEAFDEPWKLGDEGPAGPHWGFYNSARPPATPKYDFASIAPGRRSDFNADGFTDLVLTNSTAQQVAFWFTNGPNISGGAYALSGPSPITLPPNWQVVATGDFNGDGAPDLVLENTSTGQIAFWFASGNSIIAGAYATSNGVGIGVPAGWQIVGAGDFNGDGKPDLVLQNTSSQTAAIWTMNGTNVTSGAYVSIGGSPINLPPGWQIVGVGDFNADGQPDLVLDNVNTGQIAMWMMSGSNVVSGSYLTSGANPFSLPAGWQIAGIGDYNGDGQPDLALQNLSSRLLAFWYVGGTSLIGSSYVLAGGTPIALPAGWQVAGPR